MILGGILQNINFASSFPNEGSFSRLGTILIERPLLMSADGLTGQLGNLSF
jgi:hypothetical protein